MKTGRTDRRSPPDHADTAMRASGSLSEMIKPGQPPSVDKSALNETMSALRTHPRLQDAIRHMLDGAGALYGSNPLLKRILNDRGRFVGGMIALYLHFCPASDDNGRGFTVSRFQAFCVEQKLCSPGRARALLTLMCFSGHLASLPSVLDRRERRLHPTQQLIELQRRRWQYQFEALNLTLPRESKLPMVYSLPEFMPVFFRRLGSRYAAGFRLLHYAPELSCIIESNGGLLLVLHLFLLTADSMTPDGAAMPLSVSALSTRFGIARAHVRTLLTNAESAGLVRRVSGGATVTVLPQLDAAIRNFCAALFSLLLHCVTEAASEIAGGDQSSFGERATVSSMI